MQLCAFLALDTVSRPNLVVHIGSQNNVHAAR
jgi:hypothetical protein